MARRPNIRQIVLDMKRRGVKFSGAFQTKQEAEKKLITITYKRSGHGEIFWVAQEDDGFWYVRQRLIDMNHMDELIEKMEVE